MTEVAALLPGLLPALAAHLLLATAAMLLGLGIAIPLILISSRFAPVARFSLAVAGLIQTVPALALLALFYPILLWVSALIDRDLPALGFLPALLALSLYAVLPVLRNGVTGLNTLDPAMIQAADGVGMTRRQRLWWVELPLIAPLLMAGIRTAMVWTIGAATLSTTVGQPSLGDPIFAGLQTQNWTLVLAGCLLAAILALLVDGLLALVERGVAQRKRLWVSVGAGAFAVAVLAALLPMLLPQPVAVTIGAKNFSEQYILARAIGIQLEKAGFVVRYREGLGSAVIYKALQRGDIDVYVDYAGTLWTNELRRTDSAAPGQMVHAIDQWTQRTGGGRVIGTLGFENAYAFAMRADDARRRNIRTLADLAEAAPSLKLATDLEFPERPEWRAVQSAYALHFASMRPYSPTFVYKALDSGTVDAITAFSSDGRIAANRLTVLADPRMAMPRYDALLLVAGRHANDARFRAAVAPLIGHVDVDLMRRTNYLVDRDSDKLTPDQAAAALLKELDAAHGSGR